MCGIAGVIRFDAPVDCNELAALTGSMAHRGPDGEGIETWGNVGLGHRRLSIIDVESGRQPMSNEDDSVWISFNGEIYNYAALRGELEDRGHVFRSRSDTEVIVHAYEEWGDDCVSRFRGMFAFGIVDLRRRRLFLARDHLGIKPLVYYRDKGCFAFASELQALRHLNDSRFDLDLEAVDQYLHLQYIPAPRTVFRQTAKLPPASRMAVSFDGLVEGPEEYWRVAFTPDERKCEAEWLEELEAVLLDSVAAHLVSDVPFGAFLSGGIDSSLIVACMARLMDRPVRTFTIGFEEDAFSELGYAEQAAKLWGTEHHVEIVRPDALGILPDLVSKYGEPFGDSSAIPTYYVCRLARRHVPMVLSGDGGDELFAGYDSYRQWHDALTVPRPFWKRGLYPQAARFFPFRFPPRTWGTASLEAWLNLVGYIPAGVRQRLWRPEYQGAFSGRLELFEREFEKTAGYSQIAKVQYLDMKSYLPNDILAKVDGASMINSIEARTPLVDRQVVEFAATMPERFTFGSGEAGGGKGKLILKKLLERWYPAEYVRRPKMGFMVPIQEWFAKSGVLRGELEDRLLGRETEIGEYFRPDVVGRILDGKVKGQVWLLLVLEEWLRQFRARP